MESNNYLEWKIFEIRAILIILVYEAEKITGMEYWQSLVHVNYRWIGATKRSHNNW